MYITEIFEAQEPNSILVIYPGRFQPWHKGHKMVYDYLTAIHGRDHVFVTTSNKVDPPRSPFTFSEKQQFMHLTGISADRIVETRDPYRALEIVQKYNPAVTKLVIAVSEKDMAEDPRFKFGYKKDGTPTYFQPLPKDTNDMQSLNAHGYIMTVPTFNFTVLGKPMRSATEVRAQFAQADDSTQQDIIKDLFGTYDKHVHDIMKQKLLPVVTESVAVGTKLNLTKNYGNFETLIGVVKDITPSGKLKIQITQATPVTGKKGAVRTGDVITMASNYVKNTIAENFADGKNPQDKGDAKRHGINTKASVSSLRKTAKSGGRKGQLAHWLANMKSGRARAKNEDVAEGSLEELANTSPKVTQPKNLVNANDRMNEVFDTQPSNVATWARPIGEWSDMDEFNFVASNGVAYQIDFLSPQVGPDELDPYTFFEPDEEISDQAYESAKFVSFEQKSDGKTSVGRQGIEGTGVAAEVFSIVVNVILRYINKATPSMVYFQAVEVNRQRLYAKIATRLAQATQWKVKKDGPAHFAIYNPQVIKAVLVQSAVTEGAIANQQNKKFILYLNNRAIAEFDTENEARQQAQMVAVRVPDTQIKIKQEICTLSSVELKENLKKCVQEAWSQTYKNSINCSNPKGFSQKAHCAGKNEDIEEARKKKVRNKNARNKNTFKGFYFPGYAYYGMTGDGTADSDGGGMAEGEVVPFARKSQPKLTWQQVPKDVLLLASDWYWADSETSSLDAVLDPNGYGNGTNNEVQYITAKLQQKGWTIDHNDENDPRMGPFNLILTSKLGQSVLLPNNDAEDFTGWAAGTRPSMREGDENTYRRPTAGEVNRTAQQTQAKLNPTASKFVWKKPNQIGGSYSEQDLIASGFKKSQYNSWGGTQRMWDRLAGSGPTRRT